MYIVPPNILKKEYMTYITKKKIKGNTYYYAEECERKNGKVSRKWQKYLGSIEKIINAIDHPLKVPLYADIFQLGSPAAYLHIIQKYNIKGIINSVLTKRNQGLSIGFYLVLAAINRGIDVVSKRSMWNWFQTTILLRLYPNASKKLLSSQRFWDNMSSISYVDIQSIWLKIVNTILDREQIDLSCASFDGTNFYTFIGSFNVRCSLAKRGKNKQGRRDLRQINYALFCTRNDQFPLYFDVYEGNRHDSKEFSGIITKFFDTFKQRTVDEKGITVIFDKGNNSFENINKFTEGSTFHFVGSVKIDDHKDLAVISNQDKRLISLDNTRLEQVKAYRITKEIYEKTLTVVVTFNNNLYTAQIKSINNEINKCLNKLSLLCTKLEDRRSGRITRGKTPTLDSVNSQVKSILSGQYMKKLIEFSIVDYNGIPQLSYNVVASRYGELADTYLGKNIIVTDNHEWSTEDIILAYRSQYVIEDTFKQMKNRKSGSWWPMFHWTDQMIYVHGLYCSLTLLIRALMMMKVKKEGIKISMQKLHQKLTGIKEVINVFEQKKNKLSNQSVISKMDEVQSRLFEIFKMNEFLSN